MCVHRACVCGYDVANGACALVYDIDCHKIYHPRVFISLSSSSVVAWCLPLSKHLYTQVIRTLGRVCTRSLACSSHSNAYGIGHTISAPVTVVPAYILHYNTGCVENQMGYVHGFSLLCKYISIFHFFVWFVVLLCLITTRCGTNHCRDDDGYYCCCYFFVFISYSPSVYPYIWMDCGDCSAVRHCASRTFPFLRDINDKKEEKKNRAPDEEDSLLTTRRQDEKRNHMRDSTRLKILLPLWWWPHHSSLCIRCCT